MVLTGALLWHDGTSSRVNPKGYQTGLAPFHKHREVIGSREEQLFLTEKLRQQFLQTLHLL
jgi:hypothetical protein